MKLGQGGQYITPRYPDLKKTLLDPRGGFLGHLIFLSRGKSPADFSHDWAWIKNFLGWPKGGPKASPKLRQKFLDPALFWSTQKIFTTHNRHVPAGFPNIAIFLQSSKYAQKCSNFMIKMLVCWVRIKFGQKLSQQFSGIFLYEKSCFFTVFFWVMEGSGH